MGHLTEIPPEWEYPAEGSLLPADSISYLEFLSSKLLDDYEPSQFRPFRERLLKWLGNLDTDLDQQSLLSLLVSSTFVGRREFESLYRTAYTKCISNWIGEVCDLDLFDTEYTRKLRELVNSSWICPISDSLRINSFLKVNSLVSQDIRPDWRSLADLGDKSRVEQYLRDKGITRLILLEDFVGSGTQAQKAIEFAADLDYNLNILIIPMIVCPAGHQRLIDLTAKVARLSYEPALELPGSEFITANIDSTHPQFKYVPFLKRLAGKLGYKKDASVLGYKQTGAKVIMYSNCPNNTLPVFHRETSDWFLCFRG